MSTGDKQDQRGAVLLRIARSHLQRTLASLDPEPEDILSNAEPWLLEDGAVFITLRKRGELRGCVGSLIARRPLIEDVRENVVAAAQRDPRFLPVEASELDALTIEVTLLSQLEPMEVVDETDALAQLRPHQDGIVLTFGSRRSTFLPQVWDSLPTPGTFLAELKRKAGLSPTFWHEDLRLQRYHVDKWSESS
ncbi:MAG: AmmeMemoRadiSam system protein A [Acidobacteriota bacterium]